MLALKEVLILKSASLKRADAYGGRWAAATLLPALRAATPLWIAAVVQGGASRVIDGELCTTFPVHLDRVAFCLGRGKCLAEGRLASALEAAPNHLRVDVAVGPALKYRGAQV